MAKATLAYLENRPSEGAQLLEPLVSPTSDIGVDCIYALCLSAKNDDDKVIAMLENKIESVGGNSRLYSLLARIRFLRKEISLCQSAAASSLALDATNADALCFRAACYWEKKQLDLALKDCNTALAIRPYGPIRNEEKPLLIKAACLQNGGKPSEAVEVFRKALALTPDSVEANYGIWSSLSQLGRYNEALGYAAKLQKLVPDSPLSLRANSITLLMVGNYKRAEQLLDERVASNNQDSEAHQLLSTIYLKDGQFDDALASAKRSRQIAPEQALTRFAYVEAANAVLQHQRNNKEPVNQKLMDEAVAMIEKLCEESSWAQPKLVSLAVHIYELSGQTSKANAAIRKAERAKTSDLW